MPERLRDPDFVLYAGDVEAELAALEPESVDCVVTSPPYLGLRDYGTGSWEGGEPSCEHRPVEGRGVQRDPMKNQSQVPGSPTRGGDPWRCRCGARRVDRQLGLEPTPQAYVERLVRVFRAVRRVLAPHGTVWLNLGDTYAATRSYQVSDTKHRAHDFGGANTQRVPEGLKPKDLMMVPARVAIALCDDGWWLRSDVIWDKVNAMPESVTDRPTVAHEHVFLLTKRPAYYFDAEAVREPFEMTPQRRLTPREANPEAKWHGMPQHRRPAVPGNLMPPQAETLDGLPPEAPRGADGRRQTRVEAREGSAQHRDGERWPNGGRNVRSVWRIATQPFPEAHFAVFPEALVRRCIDAGCPEFVCRTCGRPRERIVEVESSWRSRAENGATRGNLAPEGLVGAGTQRAVHGAGVSHDLDSRQREVVGWSDCGHGDFRPGVVMDPFLGSGTTALVARKMGRHAVGFELSEEYAAMIERRLAQQSLFA